MDVFRFIYPARQKHYAENKGQNGEGDAADHIDRARISPGLKRIKAKAGSKQANKCY